MKNKLQTGVLVSCSGRWPRKLPDARLKEYGKWCRDQLSQYTDVHIFERIVGNHDDMEECICEFQRSGVDLVIQIIGAFTGDDICCGIAESLHAPVVLWAPRENWDRDDRMYANGLCSATMNAASLARLQMPHEVVYGDYDETRVRDQILRIVRCASVINTIHGATFGLFGYRPTAFYNCASDEVLIRRTFGINIEETDLKVIFDQMQNLDEESVTQELGNVRERWSTSYIPEENLENHCRLYLALKKIYPKLGYDYSTIKCWPEMGNAKTQPCAVLGRLADEGINIGCEGDIDAGITAFIEHCFSNRPVFICDLINIEEKENLVTFWHCGNAAPSLHNKDDSVDLADHPLAGQGSAFWCSLKSGSVTAARFLAIDGKYKLFLIRGEAVPTVRNTRGCMVKVWINTPVFTLLRDIVKEGMSHHYALVWSDLADDLKYLCQQLNIDVVEE